MKLAILICYIIVIAAQASQSDYISAIAILILCICNEVITERQFHQLKHQLKQHYKDTIASLRDDNDLLKNSLRIINLKLYAIRGHNHEQK